MREVVGVDLRFVGARRHDPVAILGGAHALAGLFERKVLEKLDAVGKFGVIFETPTRGQFGRRVTVKIDLRTVFAVV